MQARHARQIRRGVEFARSWSGIEWSGIRRKLYMDFLSDATQLEWRAFREYRTRHWTD